MSKWAQSLRYPHEITNKINEVICHFNFLWKNGTFMVLGDLINRQTSQTKVSTMKVITILNDFLTNEIPSMHKIRKQALLACVHIVGRDNELTVTV